MLNVYAKKVNHLLQKCFGHIRKMKNENKNKHKKHKKWRKGRKTEKKQKKLKKKE